MPAICVQACQRFVRRELWARLPRDACDILNVPHGSLMRLVKPPYGQPDAPRAWYMLAKRRVELIKYEVHPLDGCLFRLYNQRGRLVSLVGLHVDDMLMAGDETDAEFQKARQELREQFSFKRWTPYEDGKPLEFLGCTLDKQDGVWILHQAPYLKKIHPLTVPPQRSEDSPVGAKEISSLRGASMCWRNGCSGISDDFLARCLSPTFALQEPEFGNILHAICLRDRCESSLYDCLRAETPQLQGDKRTKIEAMVVQQKLKECNTTVRWVSFQVQYPDGLTKIGARQLLADRLRTRRIKLTADESFVAAKRKTQEERKIKSRRFAQSKHQLATFVFLARITSGAAANVTADDSASDFWVADLLGMLFAFFLVLCTWFLFKNSKGNKNKPTKRDQSTNTDEFDFQHAHLSIMSKQELWELWNLATEEEKRAHDLADSYRERLNMADIMLEEIRGTIRHLVDAIDEFQQITEGKTERHDRMIQELQGMLHEKEAVIAGKNRMIHEKNRRLESFRVPFPVSVAPRGNVWHRDENCRHLRNSSPLTLHGCEVCGYLDVHSFQPALRRCWQSAQLEMAQGQLQKRDTLRALGECQELVDAISASEQEARRLLRMVRRAEEGLPHEVMELIQLC
eukprot:s1590_g20.t1